jgi:hypothetical protein
MWTITSHPNRYDGLRTVIEMECSINIGHFAVESLSNNANINFGPTYQNSHTANSTIIGSNFNFGDHCSNISKTVTFCNSKQLEAKKTNNSSD